MNPLRQELTRIADDVYNGELDSPMFLRPFAQAWLEADNENRQFMETAFIQFVAKYQLDRKNKNNPPR